LRGGELTGYSWGGAFSEERKSRYGQAHRADGIAWLELRRLSRRAQARAGCYLAVAPVLFDRTQRGVEFGYTLDDIFKGRDVMQKRNSRTYGGGRQRQEGGQDQGRWLLPGQHRRLGVGGLDARGSCHAESASQALGRTLDYFQQHIG